MMRTSMLGRREVSGKYWRNEGRRMLGRNAGRMIVETRMAERNLDEKMVRKREGG